MKMTRHTVELRLDFNELTQSTYLKIFGLF